MYYKLKKKKRAVALLRQPFSACYASGGRLLISTNQHLDTEILQRQESSKR